MKRRFNIFLIFLCMIIVGVFIYFSIQKFKIDERFVQIPLNFNPYSNTSKYNWNGVGVQVQGGFIKGIMKDKSGKEDLVIRMLSPTSKITVKNNQKQNINKEILVENVNPINTASGGYKFSVQSSNSISIKLNIQSNENKVINISPQKYNKEYFEFVILGDNRNGYDTFSQIIDQINGIQPVFTIDNGDLVFGGDENRYRLFYETVSKLQTPLYTTLGNHDIRKNGRNIYTRLFGPPYYSFDYKNAHFVFLDSSRGWTEKRAIPEEQYIWLETDLKRSKGKQIFVVNHIPPTDPRTYKSANTLPDIPGVQATSTFEKMMDNYSQYKSMNHGFPDRKEAERFENLMKEYSVNEVFLSHIHSYLSFIKNDIRYIISGGAGAELLTTGSYYHYLRVKVTDKGNFVEMVQLPSPKNYIQDRYIAAFKLFSKSIFKEYRSIVLTIFLFIVSVIAWILWNTRKRWQRKVKILYRWIIETAKFARKKYIELERNNL